MKESPIIKMVRAVGLDAKELALLRRSNYFCWVGYAITLAGSILATYSLSSGGNAFNVAVLLINWTCVLYFFSELRENRAIMEADEWFNKEVMRRVPIQPKPVSKYTND